MEEKVCCSLHGHCDIESVARYKAHCGPHDKTNLCRGGCCPETNKWIGHCLTISEWEKKWANHNEVDAMKGGQSINYKGNTIEIITADNFPPQEIVDAAVKVENWMNTYSRGDWALCGIERRGMAADEIERCHNDIRNLTVGHTELRKEKHSLQEEIKRYKETFKPLEGLWEKFRHELKGFEIGKMLPLSIVALPAWVAAVVEAYLLQIQQLKIENADKERKLQWEKDRALRAEEELSQLKKDFNFRGECINKNYGYGKKMEEERDAALVKLDLTDRALAGTKDYVQTVIEERDKALAELELCKASGKRSFYLDFTFNHKTHRVLGNPSDVDTLQKVLAEYDTMKDVELPQIKKAFEDLQRLHENQKGNVSAAIDQVATLTRDLTVLKHDKKVLDAKYENMMYGKQVLEAEVKDLQHKHSQENRRAEHWKNEHDIMKHNLEHKTALWKQQKEYLAACHKKIGEYEKELTRRGAVISWKIQDEEIKIPEKLTLKIKPFKDREAQSFYLGKKQYLGNDLEEWVKEILRLLCQLSGEISNATGYKTWGNTLVMDRFTLQLIAKVFPLTDYEMVNNSNFHGVLLGKYLVYISDLMENEIQISYQQLVGRN